MSEVVAGIRIPDSKLAREATDLLREHGTPLLLASSSQGSSAEAFLVRIMRAKACASRQADFT